MEQLDWANTSVLVTGGTGSFGQKFAEIMLREYQPRRFVVFSRDELKQYDMRQRFPDQGPLLFSLPRSCIRFPPLAAR